MSRRGTENRTGASFIRTQLLVPAGVTLAALGYELFLKGRLFSPGTWAARVGDLVLLVLVASVMAWWGANMARSLLVRLARSEAASEEKSRLLLQRNQQLQTVLQVSRAMAGILDLEELAAVVVAQAVKHTRFKSGCLVLGPDRQGGFSIASATGLSPQHIDEFAAALHDERRSNSPVAWCQVTRQPVVVEHSTKDFRLAALKELYLSSGIEGMVAVPLQNQDRFVGALILYDTASSPIQTAEISLVSALANQAALSLETARVHTRTVQGRLRTDLAVELLERVTGALGKPRIGVSSLLPFVAQAVAKLFAPAVVAMKVRRGGRVSTSVLVEGVGVSDDWLRTVRLALEADELDRAPFPPVLTLPLAVEEAEFGQLLLFSGEPGREVTVEESRMVQAFVHVTAAALGSAALMADMRSAVEEVERAYMGTLEALTKALELRDHETEGHSRRVVQYTLAIAQKLGVPESQLVPIMRGALLHDIGKIGIPDAILKKPGPLTDEEWAIMRQHAEIGYQMLQRIDFLKQATPIIRHHHERYDGKGYPTGLMGDAIPLGARIFAVADTYDAITSDRPYRKGRSHETALEIIAGEAGTQFDDKVVQALLALPNEELARIRGRDLELVQQRDV